MKTEQVQSSRIQTIRNSFFFAAYTVWMFRAFFKTTFFYDMPFFAWVTEHAHYAVVLLCIGAIALDFRFKVREVSGLLLTTLLFWVALSSGAKAISVAVILVFTARNVSFRRIMQWTVVLLGLLLVFVVGSSLLGVIENHVFVQEEGRVRYGLGFLYCSYTSHYLLLFFILYLVLRCKVRWYEVAVLLLLNVAGYMATDTKTDLLSLALMLAGTVFLRLCRRKKMVLKVISYLGFLMPFLFWGISLYSAKAFNWMSAFWLKLNFALNGRLDLGNKALQEYPIRMFGQKIRWVGGSAMIMDPTLTYNYVDNNYLSVMLQMGVVFAFFMCMAYGRAIYISIKKGQLALAAALVVFTVIGLVNPEMRNLLYNPFLLVFFAAAEKYEGIETWKPRREWKKKKDG